jgi:Alpha/beta hydrolase domain
MSKFALRRARPVALAVAAAAAIVAALVGARVAPATVLAATSVPEVFGPIPSTAQPGDPSHDYVFYATPMDLKKVGYVEQEYFVKGVANRYTISTTNVVTALGTTPYETRIVVRRPVNPKHFSGAVAIDWQNVTAGHDIDTEWTSNADFFVRHGWVSVEASVQRVGVNGATTGATAGLGLKQWNPTRYADLDLTNGGAVMDDSQSYDVFTQIARLAKDGPSSGPNPFAGLAVQHVYAGGVSQSASFLARYYNGLQAETNVYDGFLIGLGGTRLLTTESTKAFKVYTETDTFSQAALRVPDGPTTHTWEIAGGSHVPAASISQVPGDYHAGLGWIQTRDFGPTEPLQCTNPGPSDVEVAYVFHAGYDALDRWVSDGIAPTSVEPMETTSISPTVIARDTFGIALGGVRLPKVTVPTALNNGINSPLAGGTNPLNGFCVLYGTHAPFGAATLASLYPTHGSYVSQVAQAADADVQQGVLLREDAQTLVTEAAQSTYGQ